ncbi:DNA phosphorothioation-dependent restriction protein DptF [Vagococcus sp. DIV0080]|uniref:DNA phosphorothioation-dependent restriction protein DptF n=1 Tax=Candidatus Vagococcus giribetii TaxID=2230876 RepID=A0ABS3HTW2_9ENTE|nr:DNA phosphorothioation-dependent restriction protein DptF [Vagococcus sp. DIV0080]MBO0477194.1 DNA phosphorothioation-dependent restriction protein DptF [Vagococcus sp. DIV0080]
MRRKEQSDMNLTQHQFIGKMRVFYIEVANKYKLVLEFNYDNMLLLLKIIEEELSINELFRMKKYTEFLKADKNDYIITDQDNIFIQKLKNKLVATTIVNKYSGCSGTIQDGSLNNQLESVSENIFSLLVSKYGVFVGDYSIKNLTKLAHRLNRAQKISSLETDKILNMVRVLNRLDDVDASSDDVENAMILLEQIKIYDVNRLQKHSELEILFNKLSMQSKDMIVHSDSFEEFNEYMHVKRPIQEELEEAINEQLSQGKKSVIFLVGNVGDGKSHLLAYMNDKYRNEFNNKNIEIYNDATESDAPNKTSIDRLVSILEPFNNQKINYVEDKRIIIAINLGVLTNLYDYLNHIEEFDQLVSYIEKSGIISGKKREEENSDYFKTVSFLERKELTFKDGIVKNIFYEEVFRKVFSTSESNIFYQAYLNDQQKGMTKLIHENYRYLLSENVLNNVIGLLNRIEVEFKEIISTRLLFNFMYDIVNPKEGNINASSYLPHLLFQNKNKSNILTYLNLIDPVDIQTAKLNDLAIELYHSNDLLQKIKELLGNEGEKYLPIFETMRDKVLGKDNFRRIFNTFVRIKYLEEPNNSMFGESLYSGYLKELTNLNNKVAQGEMSRLVMECALTWNGKVDHLKDDYLLKSRGDEIIRIAMEHNINDSEEVVDGFDIKVKYFFDDNESEIRIDYRIYELLRKIEKGYFIKEEDRNMAIRLDAFVDDIVKYSKSMRTNLLINVETNQVYELSKSFGKIKLQRGK